MKYYLAGYYLMQVKPLAYNDLKGQEILTCSDCINVSLLDSFARCWTSRAEDIKKAETDYNINSETISRIHNWTEQNDTEATIGYITVFNTIESAIEYYKNFFTHLNKVKLLGLYLPEAEADKLIEDFKDVNRGDDGIRHNLKKKELETDKGIQIGFDLIGLSAGGRFHTFHCHHLADFFRNEFKVEVNEFGLIATDSTWKELVEYMNDEKSAVEPDPWYFAKVKSIRLELG